MRAIKNALVEYTRAPLPKKRETRDGLVSHPLEEAVPSALQRFTARFGMELGGSAAL